MFNGIFATFCHTHTHTHTLTHSNSGNWMPFSYHLIVYQRIPFFVVVHFRFKPYRHMYRWRQHEQKCPLLCLDCSMWHNVSWKLLDQIQRASMKQNYQNHLAVSMGYEAYSYAVNRKAINKYLNLIKKRHAMKWCDTMRIALKASLSFFLFIFCSFHTRFT